MKILKLMLWMLCFMSLHGVAYGMRAGVTPAHEYAMDDESDRINQEMARLFRSMSNIYDRVVTHSIFDTIDRDIANAHELSRRQTELSNLASRNKKRLSRKSREQLDQMPDMLKRCEEKAAEARLVARVKRDEKPEHYALRERSRRPSVVKAPISDELKDKLWQMHRRHTDYHRVREIRSLLHPDVKKVYENEITLKLSKDVWDIQNSQSNVDLNAWLEKMYMCAVNFDLPEIEGRTSAVQYCVDLDASAKELEWILANRSLETTAKLSSEDAFTARSSSVFRSAR